VKIPAYITALSSLSASGLYEDLTRDFERGHRPLKPVAWKTERYHFERLLGVIPEALMSHSDPWENSPVARLHEALEILISDLNRKTTARAFDLVLVGRVLLTAGHHATPQAEMDSLCEPDQVEAVILKLLRKHGFSLSKPNSSVVIELGCATGVALLDMARKRIQAGHCSRILLISYDVTTPGTNFVLDAVGVLTKGLGVDSPKVFHAERDGFARAEAFTAVVVEDRAGPSEQIPIRLSGTFLNSDCQALSSMDPDGQSLLRCAEGALRSANIDAKQIDVVKAHGTGTLMNDRIESATICSISAGALASVPVLAFKSQFGHTLNGCGLFELCLLAHCMRTGLLMPPLNSTPLADEIRMNVVREKSYRPLNAALGLAMGFGGINGSYILEKGLG
jgi:hypothetical protein